MSTSTAKRIDFIDLAKGICIFMVVIGHCNVPINIPGYEIVRMPLYFILSGLFFKTYKNEGTSLITKKVNKILVPFLFFYLIGNLTYYGIKFIAPEYLVTRARGIGDLFTNRQFFNGPIWFLLSLFWCNIYFYIIVTLAEKEITRILIAASVGLIGWWIGQKNIFVPLFMDVSMTALPFFVLGYYLKKSNILYPNRWDRYNICFAIAFWGIAFILTATTRYRLSLHYNKIVGISTYFIAVASVLSILFLCKSIKRLPFFSYIGRYSIILLCAHHLIYRPVAVAFKATEIDFLNNSYAVAVVTMLLSTLCIPLCLKYIPWFVAQKDIIKKAL